MTRSTWVQGRMFRFAVLPLLALTSAAAVVVPGSATTSKPGGYYLALGDSMAYGMQPHKAGARPQAVDTGYVDVFAARLRKLSPGIEVVNYGCPGESTVTFTRGGCPWLAEGRKLHDAFRGAQLAAALSFLRRHPGEVSPITLTLWGNDVFPLSARGKRAQRAIDGVASRLRTIIARLRSAAPSADIIVQRRVEPRSRPPRADRAAVSLARCRDQAFGRSIARPGRRRVLGARRDGERERRAVAALQAHVLLPRGR